VVADILTVLAFKICTYRPGEGRKFRCWLKTVARNKVVEWKRRQANPLHPMPDEWHDPKARNPADAFLEKDLFEYARLRGLRIIRPRYSQESWNCFWRYCVEGDSIDEIAESTGKTPEAVWAIILRIKKRFKQEFEGMFDE
jgi:DNA-directed RNA polymerase specialized sigma24 family protein